MVAGNELVQEVECPGVWMGQEIQLPQLPDVTCSTLALYLCDLGKLVGEEAVDLYCDGCKREAVEAGWMCDPCVLEACVLDLSCANVTQLDEGLVSVTLHGLD